MLNITTENVSDAYRGFPRVNKQPNRTGRDVIFLKRCYILDVTGFARINLVSHSEEMLYSLLYDWNRMQHVRHTALDSH
jgi:hypothetical protein